MEYGTLIRLLWVLSATAIIMYAEITVDHMLRKMNKSDKPWTTIGRAVLITVVMIIFFSATKNIALTALAGVSVISLYFGFFDTVYNLSRWNDLPWPYNYKTQHNIEETKKEKKAYALKKFKYKLFYHGTFSINDKKGSPYDRMFKRIPPSGELLLKGIAVGVALHFYLNY